MNKNTKNFIKPLSVALMTCLLAYNGANAARTTAKAATTNKPAVENKASQFKSVISETTKADDSASLAEMIRKQRATADARDKESLVQLNTQMALAKGSMLRSSLEVYVPLDDERRDSLTNMAQTMNTVRFVRYHSPHTKKR